VIAAVALAATIVSVWSHGSGAPRSRQRSSDPAVANGLDGHDHAGPGTPAGRTERPGSNVGQRHTTPASALRFRFADRATRRPIEGVEVRRSPGDGRATILGESDADGLLRVEAGTTGAPQDICVTLHDRYVATRFVSERWPGVPPGEPQTVLLDAAAKIEGTARIAEGLPIPSGVLALGWPEELGSLFGMSRADLLSDPRIAAAEVGPDGSFTIEGVHPTAAHRVVVGGAGWASASGASGVRAGDAPVTVFVGAVYGARLELTEASGGELRLNHGYSGRGFGTAEPPSGESSLRRTDASSPGVALNLVGRYGPAATAREFGERWLAFQTADFPGGIVPDRVEVRFRADLPGYEPIDREVTCAWLGNGALRSEIRCAESGRGFGALRLRVEPPGSIGLLAADAVLRFVPSDGSSPPFSLRIAGAERTSEGFEWGGVPAGRYTLALAARVAGPGCPVSAVDGAREVIVAPGGLVDVRAEPTLGAVELVVTRDGAPFAGALFVTWAASGGGVGRRTLHAPPYRLEGLAAGPLELRVLRPRPPAGEGTMAPRTIEVEAAQRTQVAVALD